MMRQRRTRGELPELRRPCNYLRLFHQQLLCRPPQKTKIANQAMQQTRDDVVRTG